MPRRARLACAELAKGILVQWVTTRPPKYLEVVAWFQLTLSIPLKTDALRHIMWPCFQAEAPL